MNLTIDEALNRAIQHHQDGELSQAKSIYQSILEVKTNHPVALNYLGVILLSEGKVDEAINYIHKALQISPNDTNALVNLGLALDTKTRYEQAADYYRKALQINPTMPEALVNLGGIELRNKNTDAAKRIFKTLLKTSPQNPDALCNLGKIAEEEGDLAKARKFYHQVVSKSPGHIVANTNLGQLLFEQGNLREALPFFDKVLSQAPHATQARYNRSLIHLTLGNFFEGWRDYEWRIMNRAGRRYLLHPITNKQLPPPSEISDLDIRDKSILLVGDQGIGDELFFLRFSQKLKNKGAQVHFLATPKLEPLLQRWGGVSLWPRTAPFPPVDYVFSAGDAPLICGMQSAKDIPSSIRIDPIATHTQLFINKHGHLPKPWVGLTWEAGTRNSDSQLHKAVPLSDLLRVFKGFSGTVFVVQRNPEVADLKLVERHLGQRAIDCSSMNDDLEYALALLSCLDNYIGVSNTNMHLMDMLSDARAEVLVRAKSEFRWMLETEVSPWFPRFNVHRQTKDGKWKQALAEIQNELQNNV